MAFDPIPKPSFSRRSEMRWLTCGLATAVAALVLPQIAATEGPQGPVPPGPEMLFRLLDANHDGVISENEIPADAPEPLRGLLKAADKKGDKKVTLEAFMAAVKEHPPAMPPFGAPMQGMPGGMIPPSVPVVRRRASCRTVLQEFPHRDRWTKRPDLKALFAKMDKDKDGKADGRGVHRRD